MFKHINQISEQAFILDFGSNINIDDNIKINLFSEFILNSLKKKNNLRIRNCVPSYNKILIQFDPVKTDKLLLIKYLKSIKLPIKTKKYKKKILEIPICYDDLFALDINEISFQTKYKKKDIIENHLDQIFHVFMIGFLPGLPFMGSLENDLNIPRKLKPRIKVPKGSVGIVDNLCVIYPQDCPGGWNIIGKTPINLFYKNLKDPLYIKPGYKIKFNRITSKEFNAYEK